MPGHWKLFARAWGNGAAAPAVAILHGLGDHSGRFERVGSALAGRGFSVHALDLPGHGRSEGPRGHVRGWHDYRDAVTRWMDSIQEKGLARPWAFLGHSMGALVALEWTHRHPGRAHALVLSAPPFVLSLHPSSIKVHAARIIGMMWPGFSQDNGIPPSLLSHDPEVIRAHRSDPYVHFRISARLFLEIQAVRRRVTLHAATHALPTMILQGGADPVTSPLGSAAWARSTPEGVVTYREYPGLYHEVLNEPEGSAILDEVAEWLRITLKHAGPAEARGRATD
jgi:alpha-beta hydrolase superfamily lysophospholipase